jgi:hypothetical protein
VGGRVLDIGAGHRNDAVTAVRLLLRVLRREAPDVAINLRIQTAHDPFRGLDYGGEVDDLLAEFNNTDMLGFVIMMLKVGSISVASQSLHGTKLPYLQILGDTDSYCLWEESLLDELIKCHGIYYAALSVDDTLDLHELDHVDKDNFPWEHWNLVAARIQEPSNRR